MSDITAEQVPSASRFERVKVQLGGLAEPSSISWCAFDHCDIVGPAKLLLVACEVVEGDMEIAPRDPNTTTIRMDNCLFYRCRFENVWFVDREGRSIHH